jgi:hypothetical protein
MVDWPRPEVLGHMLHKNMALLVNRQSKEDFAVLCSDLITERKIAAVYDASSTIPLYKYQNDSDLLSETGKTPAKFTNEVQRSKKALQWERHTDSSRKVSGVRYFGCMQPDYFSRKLVA